MAKIWKTIVSCRDDPIYFVRFELPLILGLTRDLVYSVSVGLGTQTFGTGRYRYSIFFCNSGSVGLGTQLYGIGWDSKFRELSNYRSWPENDINF